MAVNAGARANQAIQVSVGVEAYIWRTQRDARVRSVLQHLLYDRRRQHLRGAGLPRCCRHQTGQCLAAHGRIRISDKGPLQYLLQ